MNRENMELVKILPINKVNLKNATLLSEREENEELFFNREKEYSLGGGFYAILHWHGNHANEAFSNRWEYSSHAILYRQK